MRFSFAFHRENFGTAKAKDSRALRRDNFVATFFVGCRSLDTRQQRENISILAQSQCFLLLCSVPNVLLLHISHSVTERFHVHVGEAGAARVFGTRTLLVGSGIQGHGVSKSRLASLDSSVCIPFIGHADFHSSFSLSTEQIQLFLRDAPVMRLENRLLGR